MTRVGSRWTPESGYSLIEMMFVVGIMGILAGIAVVQIGASRPGLVGDGGMRVVLSQMNQAREFAIAQRRNTRVTFTLGNKVEIFREKVTGETLTVPPCILPAVAEGCVVSSVFMEGGLQFVTVANLPDSPDAFCGGAVAAVSIPTATGSPLEVKFKPDGSFVNQDGAILNGTVFVSLPNQTYAVGHSTNGALSARAVTVQGSTGRVRGYRFDGSNCAVAAPLSCWKPV